MRQYLTATIQALDQSELDNLVEPLVLKHVKESDPNPEIRVYSIGHEGKSNLHLPGIGDKTFTWIQAAVQWIADKLRLGTAVFDRHDSNTNSHEGRIQIGEVIGKSVKKIGDRLNTLAAIHIFPQFKSRPLDIASFEAEIEFEHDNNQAWPTQVKSVSGIALSNSGIDTPGFPGATLLGAVQAYVQAFGGEFGGNTMNLSDVKQAVKDLGLKPSQVFEVAEIMGDGAVDKQVKEVTKEHFAMAKRVGEERDTLRDTVAKLGNDKAESEKRLQQIQTYSKSSVIIETLLADPNRKLGDKARVFIRRGLKDFATTAADDEALKVDLGKFIEEKATEYQELAKDVFGVGVTPPITPTFTIPPEFTTGGQPPVGAPPPSTVPTARDEVIVSEQNPDTNPFIPGGKAAQVALKT